MRLLCILVDYYEMKYYNRLGDKNDQRDNPNRKIQKYFLCKRSKRARLILSVTLCKLLYHNSERATKIYLR